MARLLAVLLIWGGFGAVTTSLLTSVTGTIANASGAEAFGIVVVIAIAAVGSTAVVWTAPQGGEGRPRQAKSLAKAKRRGPRWMSELRYAEGF